MDTIWIVPLAILLWFLATLVFMWLWNTTMPQVFKLPEITFWVALRLLLIAGLLTSGGFANFSWDNQISRTPLIGIAR